MDLRLSLFHAKATFAVTLQMAVGLAANTLTLREENDEKLFSARDLMKTFKKVLQPN